MRGARCEVRPASRAPRAASNRLTAECTVWVYVYSGNLNGILPSAVWHLPHPPLPSPTLGRDYTVESEECRQGETSAETYTA